MTHRLKNDVFFIAFTQTFCYFKYKITNKF